MTSPQPNRCPPYCLEPRCDNLLEFKVVIGGKQEPNDRCSEDLPMWEGCAWHTKLKINNRVSGD